MSKEKMLSSMKEKKRKWRVKRAEKNLRPTKKKERRVGALDE